MKGGAVSPEDRGRIEEIVEKVARRAASVVVMAMSRPGTPGPAPVEQTEPAQAASGSPGPSGAPPVSTAARDVVAATAAPASGTQPVTRPGEPPGGWRGYPSRTELNAASCEEDPALHSRAPWFSEEDLFEANDILSYWVDSVRMLPGGIPSAALTTEDWRRRLALPDRALLRVGQESVADARVRLVRLVCDRFAATFDEYETFPSSWEMDTWTPRCSSEYEYARELVELDYREWPRGGPYVLSRAMLFQSPTLPEGFRTISRTGSGFWESIRMERSNRNRYGFLIPHQCREVAAIRADEMARRWPRVPTWFEEYEVPQGCLAELPAAVTYVGTWLDERRDSPYWTVFLTEWCVTVAKNLLWDAYDRMYLWFISARVFDGIEYLVNNGAMDLPLGGQANANEALELARLSRSQDWDNVPRGNNHRTPPPCARHSPGREVLAGDFVFVDAATRTRITQREAQNLQSRKVGSGPSPAAGPAGRPLSWGPRRQNDRSRARRTTWLSGGWEGAVNADRKPKVEGGERERRAKIPRVDEGPPATATRLPSLPGTPARGSQVHTAPVGGAPAVAGASTQATPSGTGAGGASAGPSGRGPNERGGAGPGGKSVEVIEISSDEDKPLVKTEVREEPVPSTNANAGASSIDAMIGIAVESMLNAGMDASAIRDAVAQMRQRQGRGSGGSGPDAGS